MSAKVDAKKIPNEKIEGFYRNENYLSDTEYVVKVAKTLLTPIGIWPRSNNSKFVFYGRVVLMCGLMLCLIIPHMTWTWWKAEDLRRLMKIIAAQVFSSLAVLKYFNMVFNRDAIRHCLEDMEKDYKEVEAEEDRLIMIKNAKIARFFTVAYLGLSYGGALPYHIVMPLLQPRVPKSYGNETMIPLPYPSEYIFFTVEDPPLYQFIWGTQLMISTIILSTNTGVYSLIACVVMHSCCLFDVTANKLDRLLRGRDLEKDGADDALRKKLSFIIDYHVKAIDYAATMEDALNIVMLGEMGGCTLIICMLEYGILLDMEDGDALGMGTYMTLMTSIFVNVFILSYVGDRVKDKSEQIGVSAYNLQWYGLPRDMILQDIKFIMARAAIPTKLTAGKLFDLSLQGFCDVCKTSMAYLNFLRTLEIT